MAGGLAFAPLRSSAFRRYLVGQLPSVTCSWAQVVALSWVVVQINPRSLGWVVALQFLPSLILGPWFGAIVDRHDRRRLLILAEAGLGLVALGYAMAAAAGALTLPWIYLLASVWGVINALDTPARRSLVPMLVPPERAASASALTGTGLVLGMTLGTALGAALVGTVGVPATFALNAASFLADAILLATIRVAVSPRVRRAPHQVRDGISYVRHTPVLRKAMVGVGIVATFAFTIQVSVPIFAREAFHAGPSLIGAFFTAVTAGSLVGTLVFAARGAATHHILTRTALAMAVALLTTALAPYEFVALPCLAGVGFTWSYPLGGVIATLQSAQPQLMGRVMSLFSAVLLGGTTIGGPLATAMIAIAGPRAPFVLGAVTAVIAAVTVAPDRARIGRVNTTRGMGPLPDVRVAPSIEGATAPRGCGGGGAAYSHPMPPSALPGDCPAAIDVLLAQARSSLARVSPADLPAEVAAGALVVDIRPVDQRSRDGELPGAIIVDRNVLEWRLDPTCSHRLPVAGDSGRRVIVVCNEGYSSSLAAATLQQLGLRRATDLAGGFQAWLATARDAPQTAAP